MKLGIVMEGGASRTFFSCGATDVFLEENIYPDYFIGVSAGIAYGVSYISKQKGRNKEFTRKYMHTSRYMGMKYLLDRKLRCYYNLPFAFDEVPNKLVPFDYKTLAEFPGKCVATVINIETGRAEYKEIPPYETKWETSIASCSLPVLFQPVKLGDSYYLDGGLADPLPYKQAFAEGCDKVIVLLTRPRDVVMEEEKTTPVVNFFYQRYPKIQELMRTRVARYNADKEELLALEKAGKVFVIAPDAPLGIKRTEGDWSLLEPIFDEGEQIARREMPALRAYLES